MSRKQIRVVGLLIILVLDALLLLKGAEKLAEINSKIQGVLGTIGPSALINAFGRAEQSCWATWSGPILNPYKDSGCDWSWEGQSKRGQSGDCAVHRIPGCHDYQPAGILGWMGKHTSALDYVMHEFWGDGLLWALVWIFGFIVGMIWGVEFWGSLFLGVLIGTVTLLILDWGLYLLSYLFGYALALAIWINVVAAGFFEAALGIRETVKGVKDLAEDVHRVRKASDPGQKTGQE